MRHEHLLPVARIIAQLRLPMLMRAGLAREIGGAISATFSGRLNSDFTRTAQAIEEVRASFAGQSHPPSCYSRKLCAAGRAELMSQDFLTDVESMQPFWGMLLRELVKATRAETILELGTCIGISASYMGRNTTCRKLITIEGDPDRAQLARKNLTRLSVPAEIWTSSFDEALHAILPHSGRDLDIVLIDGEKDWMDNLRWVNQIYPHLRPGGLLIVDDIHNFIGMERVWIEIKQWCGFRDVIDLGRLGVCVRGYDSRKPKVHELFRFLGFDLMRIYRTLRKVQGEYD